MSRLGIQSMWCGKTTHGVEEGERRERMRNIWQIYQVFTVLVESAGKCTVYCTIIIVAQEV